MTEQELAERIAALTPEQRARLVGQLRRRRAEPADDGAIPVLPRELPVFPLSFAQQRVWFMEQFEPGSAQHNMPHAYRLDGPLDLAALQRALDGLVARHEALRTTFLEVDGQATQVVGRAHTVPLGVVDLREVAEDEREAAARAVAEADARRPFDLRSGPLLRATLVRLGERRWHLLLNFHHAICDGWSVDVILRELGRAYGAAGMDETPSPAVQYADYAMWQRERLNGERLESHVAFWRGELAGTPPLELPTDHPRPPVRGHAGALVKTGYPGAVARGLRQLAAEAGGTLFMALLAGLEALLSRYARQADFAVGTMVAARDLPDLEPVVGFFANTLALRADTAGDPTFAELVGRVRDRTLAALSHQEIPFEKLVDELKLPRDISRAPLFETMLVLQNTAGLPLSLAGMRVRAEEPDSRTAKFDLTFYVTEAPGGGLEVALEHRSDLFEPETALRLLDNWRALLEGAVAAPETRISRLPLLGEVVAPDTTRAVPEAPLHRLFEAQAARRPDAIAVDALTYAELDRRANQLARRLGELGAGPETLVGVAMPRGTDMVVALLGVLKAGAGYVPIDPAYPASRRALMVEDAGLDLVLTPDSLATIGGLPDHAPDVAVGPDHRAYVIYTSGSTGRPKGVQVTHRAVVNLVCSIAERCALGEDDVLLAVTSLSFDIAGLELFVPLCTGGRVVVCDGDSVNDAGRLMDALQRVAPNAMQATPATWRLLLDAGWTGAGAGLKILCGGEALPDDLAARLLATGGELWNLYGPTETTIWSAATRVTATPVPIGGPLANTRIDVLDDELQRVPAGVPGEVCIGGLGLSRGYLGRPDVTAERFVPDPFSAAPGTRLYRTGDEARYRPGDTLEFLGRRDGQIKLRGYRIELGDVEAGLRSHPDVSEAVAAVRQGEGGHRLVAYVVPRAGAEPTVAGLRAHLQTLLPDYMVPAAFATLPALPLTPNGKVDRRALPAPEAAVTASGTEYEAPATAVEETLAEVWSALLGVERVGRRDGFFALGGDSLLVVRMVARAAESGLTITAKQVFQHQTLAELASVVGTITLLATQDEVTGPMPLPIATQQLFEGHVPAPDYHSLAFLMEARERLDAELLERVLVELVRHHDGLRVRMVVAEDGRRSLVNDPWRDGRLLERVDLGDLSAEAQDEAVERKVDDEQRRFRMTAGDLFHAVLFEMGPGRPQRLLLSGHYLVGDVVSWQILATDLDVRYRQSLPGEPPRPLPRKTTSLREWLDRVGEFAASDAAAAEIPLWLAPERSRATPLPYDHPGGDNRVAANRALWQVLGVERTTALVALSRRVPMDALLMTAIATSLTEWTGDPVLPIDIYVPGRDSPFADVDLSRTVGWLTYRYPAWLTVSPDLPPLGRARSVAEQLRRIPGGGLGSGALRYFRGDPDVAAQLAAQPVPQVTFNFFGIPPGAGFQVLRPLGGMSGHYHDVESERMRPLMINGTIIHGQLRLEWEYSAGLHEESTIQSRIDRANEALVEIIEAKE